MLVLYSVNTWLAYKIAENYFNNIHYAWCSPVFNANGINPPSSDPCEIYNGLLKDISGKDHHSSKIITNKTGLLAAAEKKLMSGVITVEQKNEIFDIINEAQLDDFRPLIYVIPYFKVQPYLKTAALKLKANKFSKEYIVEELGRSDFDVIDISKNERYV